jgi:SHS2 domain-containing protein
MHEVFEHTADLGLRIRAQTLEELFADAAQGLFAMIVENLDEVRPGEKRSFRIPGQDRLYLLFDWLNELLYTFEKEKLVFVQFAVHFTPDSLEAEATGEPLDPQRHRPDHEVKAITYHGLKVEQLPEGGWLAEVIVDI